MCILFIYNGAVDERSDYSLILISNRDEYYDRATQTMAVWSEDPVVIGGRDLEVQGGGSWLAVSPTYKKLGVLLNLPGEKKKNATSRGRVVSDYVKTPETTQSYVESLKEYARDCNGFNFISVEFENTVPSVYTYCNTDNQLKLHTDKHLVFSNSAIETPLKKVEAGLNQLTELCNNFHKESMEKELVENLVALLKSDERHLPDEQLEARQPYMYKELSSIYVCAPQFRYGTRTHTIILLTKQGRLSVTEITQLMPIDPEKPQWETTNFNFDLSNIKSRVQSTSQL